MNPNLYFLFIVCLLFASCEKQQVVGNSASEKLEMRFGDSIYIVRLQAPNDSLGRENLFKLAYEYENRGLLEESKQTLEEIFKRATKKNDTLHQAKVYWYLADVYYNEQKLDSAFLYYTKAEKLYSFTKKDSLNWARMISSKAGVLNQMGIFSESEVQTIRALNILNKLKSTRLIYEATLIMALNLKDIKEYDEALKYYNKIPDLLNQLEKEGYNSNKLKRSWLSYYNNMGNFYNERKEYSKAIIYIKKALSVRYIEDYPQLHALLLNNFARSNIFSSTNKHMIDSLLASSLKIREKIDHKQGIIGSKITIGEYLLTKGDTLNALKNFQEAKVLSTKNHRNYDILRVLELLSINDKENQALYTVKYLRVKDSLYELEKATRNKFARLAYETDEIEEENIILSKRNSYLLAGVLFTSLLALLIFILLRLKMKNKTLVYQQKEQSNIQQIQDLLLKQQTITEEIRVREQDRIAKDLHDGVLNHLFTIQINLEELETDNLLTKNNLIEALQRTELQIRELSHNLHQNHFQEHQNFSLVLENLVLSQKNKCNTQFDFSAFKQLDWSTFDIKKKTSFYLILQELLQNVNKHSKATLCNVFISNKNDKIVLRVHDNGMGFAPNRNKTFGLGLTSIKERVVGLNGNLEIKSTDQNTTVSVIIPI